MGGKTRNIAIQLVLQNVAKQGARFWLPVFPYLWISSNLEVTLRTHTVGKTIFQLYNELGFYLAGTEGMSSFSPG